MGRTGLGADRVQRGTATRRGVALWRGRNLVAVLAVTIFCSLAAPAVASADPNTPTDGQLSVAQQAADAAAQQVEQSTAQLATTQNQVSQAAATANIALGRFEHEQADYDSARTAAQATQAAAQKADAGRAAAQGALALYARNSYVQGSTSPGFEAGLTSDGPQQLLERSTLLAAAGSHRTDVLTRMTAIQQQATVADDAASAAQAKAAMLQSLARTDLDTATALEIHARQQAGALRTHQSQLQAQLRSAQQTLAELNNARAVALASQQHQAAVATQDPGATAHPPAGTPGAVVTTSSRGSTPAAQTALNAAMRYVNQMYAWGGGSLTGPSEGFGPDAGVIGFDCSGLTRYAYAQAGITLPRVAADQYAALPKVAALEPGDLVFYATDPAVASTIHHVAMYLGNNQLIEAPESGERIHVAAMRYGYEYLGAVRPGA